MCESSGKYQGIVSKVSVWRVVTLLDITDVQLSRLSVYHVDLNVLLMLGLFMKQKLLLIILYAQQQLLL